MVTTAMTTDAPTMADVRDAYISAVNTALGAGRDELARELAAEYDTAIEARPSSTMDMVYCGQNG